MRITYISPVLGMADDDFQELNNIMQEHLAIIAQGNGQKENEDDNINGE